MSFMDLYDLTCEVARSVNRRTVYKTGDIRRFRHTILHRDQLVQLIIRSEVSGEWICRDILTDREQVIDLRYLSEETFNEMEVLAWAASL